MEHDGRSGGRGRRGRVIVTGTGQVDAEPDRLEVSLTLAAVGEAPGEALRTIGRLQETLLAVLDAHEVAAADRRTDTIAVRPHHDAKTGRPTGRHAASTTTTVRLTAPAGAGDLLDAAGDQLGVALRLDGIRWSFGDPAPHVADARRLAVQDGADRARQLAAAAGARLGRLRSIREESAAEPAGAQPRMLAATAASAPRPEPGRRSITVSVDLVYELGD